MKIHWQNQLKINSITFLITNSLHSIRKIHFLFFFQIKQNKTKFTLKSKINKIFSLIPKTFSLQTKNIYHS